MKTYQVTFIVETPKVENTDKFFHKILSAIRPTIKRVHPTARIPVVSIKKVK